MSSAVRTNARTSARSRSPAFALRSPVRFFIYLLKATPMPGLQKTKFCANSLEGSRLMFSGENPLRQPSYRQVARLTGTHPWVAAKKRTVRFFAGRIMRR